MYQDKMEYLTRKIKRTYKWYTKERTDGEATIFDVAELFNIKLDTERPNDYMIKELDLFWPSIEIVDNVKNIRYKSEYTGNADLLNFSTDQRIFINVFEYYPERTVEHLYRMGYEIPVISKMTYIDGEYKLSFEKEIPHSISLFINDGIIFRVIYEKEVEYDEKKYCQPLITRFIKNNYENDELIKQFEQQYTYGHPNFIRYDNTQDKYCYKYKDNIIYGVNEYKEKDECEYFEGICFQKVIDDIDNFMPLNIHTKNYPRLSEQNIQSSILFRGYTPNDNYNHSLEIYKTDKEIDIKYYVYSYVYDKENSERNKIVVTDSVIKLPIVEKGKMTSLEVTNLIQKLVDKFKNDKFIEVVISNLLEFSKKIDIQNGLIKEEYDLLSPEVLINLSFDEISNLINSNPNEYFELISNQFEDLVHINKEQIKVKKK